MRTTPEGSSDLSDEVLFALRRKMLIKLAGRKGLQAALDAETLLEIEEDDISLLGWSEGQHGRASVVADIYRGYVARISERVEKSKPQNEEKEPFNTLKSRERAKNDNLEVRITPSETEKTKVSVQYRRTFARSPLLTALEEVELGTTIAIGRHSIELLENRERFQPHEEADLLDKVEAARLARQHMLLSNQRLAMQWARKYVAYGVMDYDDLFQEAQVGLNRATEMFDYNKGNKFSTYGVWWIRQAMTRAIANSSRAVRLPIHINDEILSIRKAQGRLSAKLKRQPTHEELSDDIGVDKLRIEELLGIWEIVNYTHSLNSPIGEDNTTLLDLIADKPQDKFADEIEKIETESDVDDVISTLSEFEARVIRMRFGLGGDEPKTLEEVARFLGIERIEIRRIESRAMKKLRNPHNKDALRSHFYRD